MPTDTVRASAEALPNSRRAVLRSTLGAGAALGLIMTAMDGARAQHMQIGSPSPDAELLALQPEIEEMDRCKKAACDLHSAAEHAYVEALPPKPVRPLSKPLWSELGLCDRS